MDLARLPAKLSAHHDQGLSYYDDRGKLVRKPFPQVGADVAAARSRLEGWGVGAGSRVGLLAENSYEWVVYDLALLACGAISIPFPPEEFAQTSSDELARRYGLHLLLVSDRQRRAAEGRREWLAPIQGDPPAPVRRRDPASGPPGGGRNRDVFSLDPDVYTLVFSSGTSGKLKCLLISKRGTEAMIETFGRLYRFQPDDSILAFLPLANFQQRWMLYTALEYGFDFLLAEPARVFQAFKEMRPTLFGAPPLFYETVANRFLGLPSAQRRALRAAAAVIHALARGRLRDSLLRKLFAPFYAALGGRVRLMLIGAAPITASTLELFAMMGLPLYEGYGLTETGYLTLNLPGRSRLGSVGRPTIEGAVSLAADGEVIFGHERPLSVGYLDCDEEEIRKTFLDGNRIATGDVARFDDDGFLHLVGRKKEIIITRGGYKLHPETLEKVVEGLPEVTRAVVFGGDELSNVVMLVSLRRERSRQDESSVEEAVARLNRTLPTVSQVARVVFTEVPFDTENGLLNRSLKVDRRAVYARFRDLLLAAAPPAAPRRG